MEDVDANVFVVHESGIFKSILHRVDHGLCYLLRVTTLPESTSRIQGSMTSDSHLAVETAVESKATKIGHVLVHTSMVEVSGTIP